ncbi:MAG: Mut7-C RNAse domain-containing protein [Chloroflexi bacterium]|nr:Mut7-C RNAse domain-containing protein [Chloroflexota bacterium]
MEAKFIVDANAGKIARWLRMMGYDTLLFDEPDDGQMVKIGLAQGRTVITRDTGFMQRRAVTSGRVRALLLKDSEPEKQMRDIIGILHLNNEYKPFTRCLECNTELHYIEKTDVAQMVPPRVYEKQEQYMACPLCGRIYWRGTHWQAMKKKLYDFSRPPENPGE